MRKKAPNSASGPLSSGNTLRDSGTLPVGEPSSGDDPAYWDEVPGPAFNLRSATTGVVPQGSDLANNEADQRITRSKLPKDREKRLLAMKKIMPTAIRDYRGDPTMIAAALSVIPADVTSVINSDPELIELKEIAETIAEAKLIDIMSGHAETSRSPTAAKWLLERQYPEKYARTTAPTKRPRKGNGSEALTPENLPSAINNGGDNKLT